MLAMLPKYLGFAALFWFAIGTPSAGADQEPEVGSFEALIQSGEYQKARAGLETYVAAHPQSWRGEYQLGYVYFRLHQIKQSLDMLCKSLVLNGQFVESHKILAYDLNILGRQDLALQELERALKLDANSAECHYEMGRILYERGYYASAVKHLEQAKVLDPDAVHTYHNLGLAYAAVRENGKAVENFEVGLKKNAALPKPSAWPLIDYATYFNLQGDYARARDLLLQAVGMDASWAQAFDELSKAQRELGQTGEAIDSLRRAIALDPQKAEYHYVLARLYRQANQPEKAEEQMGEYRRSKQVGIQQATDEHPGVSLGSRRVENSNH
jgi:tetratricopeptide (TPR) repeat protein